MMELFKMCKTEMKRLFSFRNVVVTIAISAVVMVMCVATFLKEKGLYETYFYNVFAEIFTGNFFGDLLFVSIGYFVTTNVCMDIIEKVYRYFMIRSNINAYIISKYIIGVMYSFLLSVVILNLFVFVGTKLLPVVDVTYYSGGVDRFEDLLKSNADQFFQMRILFTSLGISFFVAIGMTLSVLIKNYHVAALSPFLLYIVITKLQVMFPPSEDINFAFLMSGSVRTSPLLPNTICYIILFFSSCIFAAGILFFYVMRRRCCSERM